MLLRPSQRPTSSRALQAAAGSSPGPETGPETGRDASAAVGAKNSEGSAQAAGTGGIAGAIHALKAAVLEQAGSSRGHAAAAQSGASLPDPRNVPGHPASAPQLPSLLPRSAPQAPVPVAAAGGALRAAGQQQQQEQHQHQQQEEKEKGRATGSSDPLVVACFFMARLFVMSALTLLWVFTPELYPTSIRTLGLGVCNAAAR